MTGLLGSKEVVVVMQYAIVISADYEKFENGCADSYSQ